jgi:hypothetical protein
VITIERIAAHPPLPELQLTSAIPQPMRSPVGFSGRHGTGFRRWAPPESPVAIEYSPEILQNHQDAGVLFGVRQKTRLRILAARTGLGERDPLLVGMDPVGIFVTRARGEVFLTEADLERFDDFHVPNAVALVVAGGKGGFFVREPSAAVQAIQSYEEFSAAEDISGVFEEFIPPRRLGPVWLWFAASALALLTVFVILRPQMPVQAPLALEVRANQGSLLITWGRDFQTGNLEIMDGDKTSSVPIANGLRQVTYMPFTSDVEIRLTTSDWKGQSRREIARFLGPELKPER